MRMTNSNGITLDLPELPPEYFWEVTSCSLGNGYIAVKLRQHTKGLVGQAKIRTVGKKTCTDDDFMVVHSAKELKREAISKQSRLIGEYK